MIKLYGIANCGTVRQARAWLDRQRLAYEFVDFKKTPPGRELVARWCAELGADAVVNRRGTTWRTLDPALQSLAVTSAGAVEMLVAHPSAIKRPVIEYASQLLIGFDEALYTQRLQR